MCGQWCDSLHPGIRLCLKSVINHSSFLLSLRSFEVKLPPYDIRSVGSSVIISPKRGREFHAPIAALDFIIVNSDRRC